jgi:hypothetical protein
MERNAAGRFVRVRPTKFDWKEWVDSHFQSIRFFNSLPTFPEGEGRPHDDEWLVSKIEPFGVYFRCERLIVGSGAGRGEDEMSALVKALWAKALVRKRGGRVALDPSAIPAPAKDSATAIVPKGDLRVRFGTFEDYRHLRDAEEDIEAKDEDVATIEGRKRVLVGYASSYEEMYDRTDLDWSDDYESMGGGR